MAPLVGDKLNGSNYRGACENLEARRQSNPRDISELRKLRGK
jgi:hypothetical protein